MQETKLSPEIASIPSIDVMWGAAPGQRVPARVYVRNNDFWPHSFRVDFKTLTPGRIFETFSQTKFVWGGQTATYLFHFTVPSLRANTRLYLDASCYEGGRYINGFSKSIVVTATPTIIPLGYTPEIILYETYMLIETRLDEQMFSFALKYAPDVYQDAVAEAKRIAEAKGIEMTVEGFKPVHLGWTEFKLPVGETYVALKENVAFYPVGVFSNDADFDSVKWWSGAKTEYLYDWFTKWIFYKEEKQGIMTPQPVFKSGESFTFEVHSEVPKAKVDAWILGYVVLPTTMKEQKITR